MTEYERVKKKALLTDGELEELYHKCNTPNEYGCAIAQAQLDKALKAKGVLLECDDQSLPCSYGHYDTMKRTQQDILKPDSEGRVWKKVAPKEE